MGENGLPAVGIVGGTGREGAALALRLAQAGFEVIVGSRSEERAIAKAREYSSALRDAGLAPTLRGMTNEEMAGRVDMAFLTVPFQQAVASVRCLRFRSGATVVDASVPVLFQAGKPVFVEIEEGSVSELLQGAISSEVAVVGAFKTIPSKILGDLDVRLDCDVLVCGDSDQARALVMQTAARLPGLRPVDAGPLWQARTLEKMAFLAIGVNIRYQIKAARFCVVGL